MIIICRQCGKSFVGRKRNNYCSKQCYHESIKNTDPKVCLSCGKKFINRRKRLFCSVNCRIEHRKFNRVNTCKFCAKEFIPPQKKPTKKYCSNECYNKSRWTCGVKTCPNCGEKFRAKRNETLKHDQKYCCRKCYDEYRAKNKPSLVVKNCLQCGKEFVQKYPNQKFCSRSCPMKYFYSDHNNYKGWKTIKISMIEKSPKCSECGFDLMPGILQLHHKDRNSKNNTPDNVVILCPNCHEIDHYKAKDGRYVGSSTRRKIET